MIRCQCADTTCTNPASDGPLCARCESEGCRVLPGETLRLVSRGRQVVTVNAKYAYAWSGSPMLRVGDVVTLPASPKGDGEEWSGEVTAIGGEWDGHLAEIIGRYVPPLYD